MLHLKLLEKHPIDVFPNIAKHGSRKREKEQKRKEKAYRDSQPFYSKLSIPHITMLATVGFWWPFAFNIKSLAKAYQQNERSLKETWRNNYRSKIMQNPKEKESRRDFILQENKKEINQTPILKSLISEWTAQAISF